MDNCIVCCQSNYDVFSRITTVSSEWKEWNIKSIIEKHLWWWYMRPSTHQESDQWICRQCWQELLTFHNFYIKVEKENKQFFQLLNSSISSDIKELEKSLNIKMEQSNVEQCSILTENLMQLEKPKRGRKRKIIDRTKSIHIEELPLIEIKSENEEQDILELCKTELNVSSSTMEADEVISIDWKNSFLNANVDSDDNVIEENELENSDDDYVPDLFLNKKLTSKRQAKTKSKKINKNPEVIGISKASEITKKSDEFIAANQFVLSCSICSTTLDNFSDLKNHFRDQHNISGYATCCNQKFYNRGVIVDHINFHKDPNYFKCRRCDKALSSRRSYEIHMQNHQLNETRETVFTCDKCNKSFFKKSIFERHLLIHVPEEDRNFQCNFCDKKYATENLRKVHQNLTHLKTYTKFCHICGKLLRDKLYFMQHMSENHNGKPLTRVKCEICGAEWKNKYILNRHMKKMHARGN